MSSLCLTTDWKNITSFGPTNSFLLLSMNIRSMHSKFSEFLAHIMAAKVQFKFIILTETWVNEMNDFAFDIDGYECLSLYREGNNRGGGIKIYYLKNIKVERIDSISGINQHCEQLFLRSYLPGLGRIIIGAIYRPPQLNVNGFCGHLGDILSIIGDGKCVITGDININILNKNSDSNVRNYIDLYVQHGFWNEINIATYSSPITNTDISCLDHILTNIDSPRKSLVIKPSLSDHYPVCLILKSIADEPGKTIQFRDYSNRNISRFQDEINHEFENYNPPIDNPNEHARYLFSFLYHLMNKYFPIKSKTLSLKRIKAPWINSKILKCIEKKHRWHRLLKSNIITKQCYKKYVSDLRRLLRLAEEKYYQNKLEALDNNIKKTWKTLNNLLGKTSEKMPESFCINNETIPNSEEISEEFSKYFISNPKNIHDSVPAPSGDYSYLIPRNVSRANFEPCTENEIQSIISKMKKEGGPEDISRRMLRLCGPFAVRLIASLINSCMTQGVFPDILKLAKITPVFKKGQKNLVQNYRPISVLNNLNKIFEAVLYSRLKHFLVFKKYFPKNNMASVRTETLKWLSWT